ncbi:MAG: hypothetical protein ABI748_10115 [Dokdonella sp.]
MTHQTPTQPAATTAPNEPRDRRVEAQPRASRVAFDYDAGYGHRSAWRGSRRYADQPARSLFHCG